MKELKQIDYKLLFELMKDSHRSDRQLAKTLGVSQPTVTRRRAMLEKNFIDGYTVIPKFGEVGFEIAAVTLFRSNLKEQKGQEKEESIKKLKEWYMKQTGVVLALDGMGLGWNSGLFSLHENFTSFTDFRKRLETELSDWISDRQTFIFNFGTDTLFRPFNLKHLTIDKKIN